MIVLRDLNQLQRSRSIQVYNTSPPPGAKVSKKPYLPKLLEAVFLYQSERQILIYFYVESSEASSGSK